MDVLFFMGSEKLLCYINHLITVYLRILCIVTFLSFYNSFSNFYFTLILIIIL